MTPPAETELGCGCRVDAALGMTVRVCPAHDNRTTRVRVSALFSQLALELHGAYTSVTDGELRSYLRQAAATCVKLSRATLGAQAAEAEPVAPAELPEQPS